MSDKTVMGRRVSDPLFEAIENMGVENNRLQARVKELEELTGQPAPRIRADRQGSTPEIQQMEHALAQRKRAAELTARAPPGGLHEHRERDETGRVVKTFYGDPEATWGPFKLPPQYVRGFKTKFE